MCLDAIDLLRKAWRVNDLFLVTLRKPQCLSFNLLMNKGCSDADGNSGQDYQID